MNNRVPHSTPLTLKWLESNYEIKVGSCFPRCSLYSNYLEFCGKNFMSPVNAASLGKIIRQQFPHLTTRRLGTRGKSKYHYYGLAPKKEPNFYVNGGTRNDKLTFECLNHFPYLHDSVPTSNQANALYDGSKFLYTQNKNGTPTHITDHGSNNNQYYSQYDCNREKICVKSEINSANEVVNYAYNCSVFLENKFLHEALSRIDENHQNFVTKYQKCNFDIWTYMNNIATPPNLDRLNELIDCLVQHIRSITMAYKNFSVKDPLSSSDINKICYPSPIPRNPVLAIDAKNNCLNKISMESVNFYHNCVVAEHTNGSYNIVAEEPISSVDRSDLTQNIAISLINAMDLIDKDLYIGLCLLALQPLKEITKGNNGTILGILKIFCDKLNKCFVHHMQREGTSTALAIYHSKIQNLNRMSAAVDVLENLNALLSRFDAMMSDDKGALNSINLDLSNISFEYDIIPQLCKRDPLWPLINNNIIMQQYNESGFEEYTDDTIIRKIGNLFSSLQMDKLKACNLIDLLEKSFPNCFIQPIYPLTDMPQSEILNSISLSNLETLHSHFTRYVHHTLKKSRNFDILRAINLFLSDYILFNIYLLKLKS
ncbi:unnamed protein product [Gordionus sp. m RMFG-2023]|uniref:uncharacterized protein LOC135926278 n=1 Tax=Gordionus sp. m RMFG-2023 TaxID=3053472 RepID=UPI0030E5BC17